MSKAKGHAASSDADAVRSILTINAGSSSIRMAVYAIATPLRRLLTAKIDRIGLRGTTGGGITQRPDGGLRKIAEETGGGYFELRGTTDMNSAFTRVANELHSQYVLGFAPDKLDGKIHKIEVRVKQPGLTARTRKSYIATP